MFWEKGVLHELFWGDCLLSTDTAPMTDQSVFRFLLVNQWVYLVYTEMLGWGITYRSVVTSTLTHHQRLTQAHLQRWVWLHFHLVYNCLASHKTTNPHTARTELHMAGRETWEQEEARLPANPWHFPPYFCEGEPTLQICRVTCVSPRLLWLRWWWLCSFRGHGLQQGSSEYLKRGISPPPFCRLWHW